MLVRSTLLTSHKWRKLVSSGRLVCRCHVVFLWFYFCFVLFCFVFVFMLSLKPRPFVQSPFDMQAPDSHKCLFLFFHFCLFGDAAFLPSIFCTVVAFSFNGEYVVRSFLPNGVFLPCDHRLGFLHQLMREFNQSIKLTLIVMQGHPDEKKQKAL